ncbi:MAG: glycine cleavage system aminomethyltransferase GcvT [Candidatus Sumerlaeia bacterium]
MNSISDGGAAGAEPSGQLKHTPLHDEAVALGARMVPFADWRMPLHFGSVLTEHLAVRERAGVFDVSHMGRFLIEGPDARRFILRLTPARSAAMTPGKALYTILLQDQAGILDDLLVYTLGDSRFLLVVNAATRARDWDWMAGVREREGFDARMTDLSADLAMVALQGPLAASLMSRVMPSVPLDDFYFYEHRYSPDEPLLVGRTGYTGEDGFEIIAPNDRVKQFWHEALEAGAQPCGLGCRDTLRLEMAYPLYGSDIDDHTTPIEAGLGWTVDWERRDFIGAEALHAARNTPPSRQLVRLRLEEKGVPRHGCPILLDGRPVGEVTSGGFSPTLQAGIAMGYIRGAENINTIKAAAAAHEDPALAVGIRGQAVPAGLVKRSFVPPRSRNRK